MVCVFVYCVGYCCFLIIHVLLYCLINQYVIVLSCVVVFSVYAMLIVCIALAPSVTCLLPACLPARARGKPTSQIMRQRHSMNLIIELRLIEGRSTRSPLCACSGKLFSGWATGPLRKGFVGFGNPSPYHWALHLVSMLN